MRPGVGGMLVGVFIWWVGGIVSLVTVSSIGIGYAGLSDEGECQLLIAMFLMFLSFAVMGSAVFMPSLQAYHGR